MAKIIWDDPSQRRFHTGVDRVVYYPHKEGYDGEPWHGVVSINLGTSGTDVSPIFMDGVAVAFDVQPGYIEGSLEAFSYPDSFASLSGGETPVVRGLIATGQPTLPFDMVYRSREGDASTGEASEYTIHLVYNILAVLSDRTYTTISDSTEPETLSWDLFTTPKQSGKGTLATSHYKLESRNTHPYIMSMVEDHLYGYEMGKNPSMITTEELADILTLSYPELLRNAVLDPSFEHRTNYSPFAATAERSSNWSSTGNYSLRLTPNSTNINSMVSISRETEHHFFPNGIWIAGSVKIHVPTELDEANESYLARRLVITSRDANNYETQFMTPAVPRHRGVYTSLLSPVRIPTDSTYIDISLWNGRNQALGGDIYFDDLVLLRASTENEINQAFYNLKQIKGSYFDGDTQSGKWGFGEWDGTPHDSESLYRSFGL